MDTKKRLIKAAGFILIDNFLYFKDKGFCIKEFFTAERK